MAENRSKPSKKITAMDVAERAGVSKYMVSRAFTEGAYVSSEKRELIKAAAEELGYRPNLLARSLSKSTSQLVGVVVDDFSNFNLLPILDELTSQLQRNGYSTMLLNVADEKGMKSALQQANQFQIDGVIFLGAFNLADRFVDLLQDMRHIPLIVLYRNSDLPNVKVVDTDDRRAGREIAQLLIDEGHERLGYMAGPSVGMTRVDRLLGFEEEILRQGKRLEAVLDVGSYSRSCGYKVLRDYLSTSSDTQRFDAIFCENDMLAIGAIDALRDTGIDMGVVGFDGITLGASVSYQLTSYRQPLEALAAVAIRSLRDQDLTIGKFLAPGEVVLRKSHQKMGERKG